MNPEWVIRLLWALAIMAGGLGVYYLFSRFALRKARAGTPLLPQAERGRPILVYFTTPTCAPCKTIQRPAIQRLQELLGDAFAGGGDRCRRPARGSQPMGRDERAHHLFDR
jgi:thiol-disulfide isomerase/thioredoxin